MDELARELGLRISERSTGWNYLPSVVEEGISHPNEGIGVYSTSRGVEINLEPFRELSRDDIADELGTAIEGVRGKPPARLRTSVPCDAVLQNWTLFRIEVIEPYFRVRMAGAMTGRG